MEDETEAPIELLKLSSSMIVRKLLEKMKEAEVMIGTSRKQRLFIPRTPMVDKPRELPWTMRAKAHPSQEFQYKLYMDFPLLLLIVCTLYIGLL